MRRPRLNALRTFEAAGRRLSFSLAAAELNITQAAVSQQIRHLEAYLGQALFVRRHRQISMTPVGLKYLDAVHLALDRLDTVTDQLFGEEPSQIVCVKCTISVATLWLAPRLHDFQANNSGIELQIRTQDQTGEGGLPTDADFEILVSANPEQAENATHLLDAKIVPVAAPDYLLGHDLTKTAGILTLELIHILGYDEDWHSWFDKFGLDVNQVRRGLTADSSLLAIDAALRGDGVFLGRRPFIDAYLKSGKLVEVFDKPHSMATAYYVRKMNPAKSTRNKKVVFNWLMALAHPV